MLTPFATIDDIITLFRPLTPDETTKAYALLPLISNELRWRAEMVNLNLDEMIAEKAALGDVAREVTVSAISRVLRENTTTAPMTQESQSGLGYSWSGTYAIAGGGIGNAILPSDLKRLGIKRQRYGVIDFYNPENATR